MQILGWFMLIHLELLFCDSHQHLKRTSILPELSSREKKLMSELSPWVPFQERITPSLEVFQERASFLWRHLVLPASLQAWAANLSLGISVTPGLWLCSAGILQWGWGLCPSVPRLCSGGWNVVTGYMDQLWRTFGSGLIKKAWLRTPFSGSGRLPARMGFAGKFKV